MKTTRVSTFKVNMQHYMNFVYGMLQIVEIKVEQLLSHFALLRPS